MKLFKKLSTLCVGFLVLMTTFSFAMATENSIPDLAEYPKPFLENGKYNFIPVYGDLSKGDDIAGAWDVLAGLNSGQTTNELITTGIQEEVELNSNLDVEFGELNDNDLEILKDGEIKFDGGSYDYHDVLYTNLFRIATSINSDREYGSDISLEVPAKGTLYRYFFDDQIDLTEADSDQPIKINVLSKEISITDIKSDTSMEIQIGSKYFVNVGDSIESNGKTVTLLNVGTSAIVIDVNGEVETIREYTTEYVNGLAITVNDLFFRDQLEHSSAELIVGKETVKTIDNNDDFLDEEDGLLTWILDDLTTNPIIGVKINMVIDDFDDDFAVVGNGCLKLDDYLNVCLDGLTESDYAQFYLNFDNTDVGNSFILESSYDEAFKANGEESDVLVFDKNGNEVEVYIEDEHNDLIQIGEANSTQDFNIDLKYKDSKRELDVKYNTTSGIYGITIDEITVEMNDNWNSIDNVEAEGVLLNNRDYDVLLSNGDILRDPENGLDDNEVNLEIPADDQKAKVSIRTDSKVMSESNDIITEVAPPMVKASEISNPGADNLMVFGGPAVNSLSAQFLGETWTFNPGEAIIELKANSGKILMVVAGTDAVDTRRACRVLRDYNQYSGLTGQGVIVSGTTSTFTDTIVSSGTTTTTTLSGNQTA